MSRRAPVSDAARLRAVKRRIWNAPQRFRVACALGIESLTAAEVAALPGVRIDRVAPGVVDATGPFDAVYAALLRLRTADAVRLLLGDEAAVTFPMLHDHLDRLDWALWLPRRCRLDVRVRSRESRLRDDAGIERTVRQALRAHGVCDRAEDERGGDVGGGDDGGGDDAPRLGLRVELRRDRVQVWIDAAGPPLHRRTGARHAAPTSLRETTAAALCAFALPRDADLVVDPFCGSGTLLEEAASWLDHACPGAGRAFALQASPAWKDGPFRHVLRTACENRAASAAGLVGSDADHEALRAARANAASAGLADRVRLAHRDARDVDFARLAAEAGSARPWLLANPPYGRRAEARGASPDALLAQVLGAAAGWSFALLYPDPEAVAAVPGVTVDAATAIRIRGLPVAMIQGRVATTKRSPSGAAPGR